jgi:hypothetical protein
LLVGISGGDHPLEEVRDPTGDVLLDVLVERGLAVRPPANAV